MTTTAASARRGRLPARLLLAVAAGWAAAVLLGTLAGALLVAGLDLRHDSVRTVAVVTSFYRSGHGGYRTTLAFTGRDGSRLTESTSNFASRPVRGALVPIYYVPDDPADLQDARTGPPGTPYLVAAGILGILCVLAAAGAGVFPRYSRRMYRQG